jgi:hypothetical protein
MLAFSLIIAFATVGRVARAAAWMYRKARQGMRRSIAAADSSAVADPPSNGRRRFLEQSAMMISATPFVAAAYGLLYGRLDVEVVRQRIRLARLPKAFEGFRIAQLSDIHIGPFSKADYIRHCVTITNGLKPDLIVLTGDYVAWDPEDQGEVVLLLAALRAPYGVYGCLGNHEREVGIEDSITHLFSSQGIRILRQERAAIQLGGEMLNLIGIDDGPTARLIRFVRPASPVTAPLEERDHEQFLQQFKEVATRLDSRRQNAAIVETTGYTHSSRRAVDLQPRCRLR